MAEIIKFDPERRKKKDETKPSITGQTQIARVNLGKMIEQASEMTGIELDPHTDAFLKLMSLAEYVNGVVEAPMQASARQNKALLDTVTGYSDEQIFEFVRNWTESKVRNTPKFWFLLCEEAERRKAKTNQTGVSVTRADEPKE